MYKVIFLFFFLSIINVKSISQVHYTDLSDKRNVDRKIIYYLKPNVEDGEWFVYENKKKKARLLLVANVKNKRLNGELIFYQHNSFPYKLQYNFKNDTLNGLFAEYFTENLLYQKGNYNMGQKSGQWFVYIRSGQVIEEILYVNNTDVKCTKWDNKQRITRTGYRDTITNNKTVAWKNNLGNDSLIEFYSNNDSVLNITSFYENAQIKETINYTLLNKEYVKDGPSIFYNNVGVITRQERWDKGVLIN